MINPHDYKDMLKRHQVITEIAKRLGAKKGAELGVWRGAVLFGLMKVPNLHMIGVDQWKVIEGMGDKATNGFSDYKGKDIEEWGIYVRRKAERECKGRIDILHMDTITAAEYVKDGSLDFVWIDADHRKSFVRADIGAWMPKVRKGGILCGHDTHIPAVRSAIDWLFGDTWVELGHDHVWAVHVDR
jgi:hypothetical protein